MHNIIKPYIISLFNFIKNKYISICFKGYISISSFKLVNDKIRSQISIQTYYFKLLINANLSMIKKTNK